MATELPDYYFRIRENGAMVFRVDTENRHNRINMDQIAVLNIKNGDIKPHGDTILTDDDMDAITKWMEARKSLLTRRNMDDLVGTVERLNLTTQWANSRATDTELETITDDLLLAMHDLRNVLVRKKSGRLGEKS